MKKIQQGDVLFKQIDPNEFKNKLEESRKKAKERKSGEYKHFYSGDERKAEDIRITSQYYNDKEPEGPLDGGRCTVALGEATGHHHSFESGTPGVVITAYEDTTVPWSQRVKKNSDNPAQCHYVSVESDNMKGYGVITHQEHNPIEVPSGYYKIEIVKEFDHLSGLERRVID
tara:strand:- start:10910 stop:11425 length:516 start_codon:yes stop_codon:yes gene_type:complete